MAGKILVLGFEGLQYLTTEILRHTPHVHLGRLIERAKHQVGGGILRNLGGDDREALWAIHQERFQGTAKASFRS